MEGDEVIGQESARLRAGRNVLIYQHLSIQQSHVVRLQLTILAHQLHREPHLRRHPVAAFTDMKELAKTDEKIILPRSTPHDFSSGTQNSLGGHCKNVKDLETRSVQLHFQMDNSRNVTHDLLL